MKEIHVSKYTFSKLIRMSDSLGDIISRFRIDTTLEDIFVCDLQKAKNLIDDCIEKIYNDD